MLLVAWIQKYLWYFQKYTSILVWKVSLSIFISVKVNDAGTARPLNVQTKLANNMIVTSLLNLDECFIIRVYLSINRNKFKFHYCLHVNNTFVGNSCLTEVFNNHKTLLISSLKELLTFLRSAKCVINLFDWRYPLNNKMLSFIDIISCKMNTNIIAIIFLLLK